MIATTSTLPGRRPTVACLADGAGAFLRLWPPSETMPKFEEAFGKSEICTDGFFAASRAAGASRISERGDELEVGPRTLPWVSGSSFPAEGQSGLGWVELGIEKLCSGLLVCLAAVCRDTSRLGLALSFADTWIAPKQLSSDC